MTHLILSIDKRGPWPRPAQVETLRRQAIEQIALEMPSYGHRPMTAELQRRNLATCRDRVLRYHIYQ